MLFEKSLLYEVVFWMLLGLSVFSLRIRGFEEWWTNILFALLALGSVIYGHVLGHYDFFEGDEGLIDFICILLLFSAIMHGVHARYRLRKQAGGSSW